MHIMMNMMSFLSIGSRLVGVLNHKNERRLFNSLMNLPEVGTYNYRRQTLGAAAEHAKLDRRRRTVGRVHRDGNNCSGKLDV